MQKAQANTTEGKALKVAKEAGENTTSTRHADKDPSEYNAATDYFGLPADNSDMPVLSGKPYLPPIKCPQNSPPVSYNNKLSPKLVNKLERKRPTCFLGI